VIDENALLVLRKRYLLKDADGTVVETPEGLFDRVASFVAKAEENYRDEDKGRIGDVFRAMFSNLEFLPNSPTLMNAGRELGQLAACFVLPIEDSLDSIFEEVKNTAKIHQSGGGTGFSFSHLRPKDDIVASTMGIASGPVSFIKIFNMATDVIKQGGTRRGANMGVLRIDHPDIEEFITIKRNPQELTNFNLSVAVTDGFMAACRTDGKFSLVNPRTGKLVRRLKAMDLFTLLAESAWASGEPGVIFIDTVNRHNPTRRLGQIEATNPCGEMPLLPYESCCLGSINLAKLVQGNKIDWARLRDLARLGVRFLDNVLDMNRYPLPKIETVTMGNRKVGLGVMGFAHMLVRLGVPYDSEEASRIGAEVMAFIRTESRTASRELAEKRGVFPNYPRSIWGEREIPQRNATTTTIAPTGTLSILAGTSSGIEPIYDTTYRRVLLGDIEVNVTDPLYRELAPSLGGPELSRLFRKSHEIAPQYHLAIQKAFQDHVDNAVSKTINLPESVTVEEILQVYLNAHRMGLKGITIFRDKSRQSQVLSCGARQPC
jgi:ribonucleoside-diphosphate reductase alpha chain